MADTKGKNLLSLVSAVAALLPQRVDDEAEDFVLSAENLPQPPAVLDTDQLIIKRGCHDYCDHGTWRIDYPQVFARKDVYEALGIVTASVLLHSACDRVMICLTNPRSEIRMLRIEFEHPDPNHKPWPGLYQIPTAFTYCPLHVERFPWLDEHVPDPEEFPRFNLTNENDFVVTEEDWANRDVLYGFGSAEATARLIQLFLDMSRVSNATTEILLESEAGYRGVAPASAEIRFYLPGGDAVDSEFP